MPVTVGVDYVQRVSLEQDVHLSVESSTHMPRKGKKRDRSLDNRLIALPPPATDRAIQLHNPAYSGAKKPTLVLRFSKTDYGWQANLGQVFIQIRQHGEFDDFGRDQFTAILVRKQRRGFREIFRAKPHFTPAGAVRHLCQRHDWFFYSGVWQSLEWVYKSIRMPAFSKNDSGATGESGLKSGDSLHVQGVWRWNFKGLDKPAERHVSLTKPADPALLDGARFVRAYTKIRRTNEAFADDKWGFAGAISRWTGAHRYPERAAGFTKAPIVPRVSERVPDAVTLESGNRF